MTAPLSQHAASISGGNGNPSLAVPCPAAMLHDPAPSPVERLRAHPASSIHATMDPTPKGPVEFVLVHKPPAWLFPVRNDKRIRTGIEYQAHFTHFTADVKARGVQQPVIAVTEGDAARVVDGETRRQASLLAGLDLIPILLYQRELSEAELVIAQLQANAQRRDFTPLELAAVYQELMRLNDWNQAQLARAIHVSPAQVAKVLAISGKLSPEVQELVAAGKLAPRAGYAISRLPMSQQLDLARKAADLPMDVTSVEGAVHKLLGNGRKIVSKPVKFCACGITGTIKGDPVPTFKAFIARGNDVLKQIERNPALGEVLARLLKGEPPNEQRQ